MRRWLLGVVVAAALGAAFACGEALQLSDEPPAASDASADAATNDATTASDAGESCDAQAHDLAGCLCASAGARSACYQGVPGPKSGCVQPGTQACSPGGDGKLRWEACKGGSMPAATETCFDDVDEDCDGRLNQGCTCSEFVDLCKPDRDAGAAPFDPEAYTLFTVPAAPKAGVAFDLFIVTKNRPLNSPGLLKNGLCYGGGLSKACASTGSGCAGWKVGFFHNVKEPEGDYDFKVVDPQGPTGCEGPEIGGIQVIVAE
jgi:hypothetical protein